LAKALILTIITGMRIGQRHEVAARTSVLGSNAACDVVIQDRQIEPRHAELRHMLDSWFIVPLSASANVAINGRPTVGQGRLKPGDRLSLGSTTFEVAVEELQEQAIALPAASTGVPRLGEYFLRRGLMTADQIRMTAERQQVLQRSGAVRAFGEIAHEMGFVNRAQLDRALADQRLDFNDSWHD
jgi:predicted component of type VI protein secretion system